MEGVAGPFELDMPGFAQVPRLFPRCGLFYGVGLA
jgi:hypothetical protein